MTFQLTEEELKEQIKSRYNPTDFLQKRSGDNAHFICPFCGSGTHEHGTPALTYYDDTKTVHCFSCGKHTDVIGIVEQIEDLGYYDALDYFAKDMGVEYAKKSRSTDAIQDFQGVSLDNTPLNETFEKTRSLTGFFDNSDGNTTNTDKTAYNPNTDVLDVQTDYCDYYGRCRKNIQTLPDGRAYLESRGIRLETALNLGVGFDPESDPANNAGGLQTSLYPTPRLIVPISPGSYVTRALTETNFKKLNSDRSSVGVFNPKALFEGDDDFVIVTEGFFDALSLIECGYRAVATNSGTNTKPLIDLIASKSVKGTIILCFDNDDEGRKATKTVSEKLQTMDIPFEVADISSPYKDPNEHFQKSRDTFLSAIESAKQQLKPKPDNVSDYIDTLMGTDIKKVRKCIKTGFDELDKCLGGGLYAGLYVVGAISSLGKTTFVHQIADNIARNGNDVIFFSLEQSKLELVSKSIARTMYKQDPSTALTSLSIRRGRVTEAVVQASNVYKQEVGDRFSIKESTFSHTVNDIIRDVRAYIRKTGIKPVVVIDYLQIIQPEPTKYGRPTPMETMDFVVSELERFSKTMGLTIIVISSVNRSNYLTPIDFESLKHSGGIEFTADVVLGMQLTCLNDDLFDEQGKIKAKREKIRKCKGATPRRVEIVGLKNRFACPDFTCHYLYHPANEYFEPEPEDYFEV